MRKQTKTTEIKIGLFGLLAAIGLLFGSCEPAYVDVQTAEETADKTSMFVSVEVSSSWAVVYHKETKVMYAVSSGAYSRGDFTLLVNADGTPMIYEETEK